jgi:IS6 family transposase
MAGHRFPRDIIVLAVRSYVQLGAAAERIAGILADRGIDVSGRTILRRVQKFGPALSEEIRRWRKPVSTTWLVDETKAAFHPSAIRTCAPGAEHTGPVSTTWRSRRIAAGGTTAR